MLEYKKKQGLNPIANIKDNTCVKKEKNAQPLENVKSNNDVEVINKNNMKKNRDQTRSINKNNLIQKLNNPNQEYPTIILLTKELKSLLIELKNFGVQHEQTLLDLSNLVCKRMILEVIKKYQMIKKLEGNLTKYEIENINLKNMLEVKKNKIEKLVEDKQYYYFRVREMETQRKLLHKNHLTKIEYIKYKLKEQQKQRRENITLKNQDSFKIQKTNNPKQDPVGLNGKNNLEIDSLKDRITYLERKNEELQIQLNKQNDFLAPNIYEFENRKNETIYFYKSMILNYSEIYEDLKLKNSKTIQKYILDNKKLQLQNLKQEKVIKQFEKQTRITNSLQIGDRRKKIRNGTQKIKKFQIMREQELQRETLQIEFLKHIKNLRIELNNFINKLDLQANSIYKPQCNHIRNKKDFNKRLKKNEKNYDFNNTLYSDFGNVNIPKEIINKILNGDIQLNSQFQKITPKKDIIIQEKKINSKIYNNKKNDLYYYNKTKLRTKNLNLNCCNTKLIQNINNHFKSQTGISNILNSQIRLKNKKPKKLTLLSQIKSLFNNYYIFYK
ncbi:hypothetical protein M0813_26169 [Anaeramoeba flamelloides]|uniref:Uncharacterized protein n=1 Tax=Anaeramoeba flamelloides TaxID=1746091 RepID=A0ABQ8Y1Z0_9EUKA|nr:hypothetical protein M0813_26169 [Anaeramoeba flamelloides]